MNTYVMSRRFWDWSYANPRLVKPIHSAIYFFAIDHCNRIGWKREYGFPTVMTMEAIGVHSYNTYKKGLEDLVDWGFIKMIERSKNQYSSNIIALSFFDEAQYEAPDKALDRAVSKHATEHCRSTIQSTVSIYKQENIEQENKEQAGAESFPSIEDCIQASQMSGFTKEQGEAYYHFRNANGWMVARGKEGNLFPIANWRSDMVMAITKGYLDKKSDPNKLDLKEAYKGFKPFV
jgi:hypothetical protein